jgi:hypothetical protein
LRHTLKLETAVTCGQLPLVIVFISPREEVQEKIDGKIRLMEDERRVFRTKTLK